MDGVDPPAPGVQVIDKGAYARIAIYSGDVNNAPAVSDCGEEFFRAEDPATPTPTAPATPTPTSPATPTAPATPTVPVITPTPSGTPVAGLPGTGSGAGGHIALGAIVAMVTIAGVGLIVGGRRRTEA